MQTLVADVIVPEIFHRYVAEKTATLSDFWKSGVIATDEEFGKLAGSGRDTPGGQIVTMPFWQDLTGRSQVLSDVNPLVTKKISAAADAAVIHQRGDAWSYNDLAKFMSGSDPGKAIMDFVAAYWERDMQAMLLSQLIGIFNSPSMDSNQADIFLAAGSTFTDANFLNAETFIDGAGLMGDAASKLTAVAMHSAVMRNLRKNDLIDFIPDSQGQLVVPTFQGLRVIQDDGMTQEVINGAPVYSTYLFGQGAVALGDDLVDSPVQGGFGTFKLEFGRVPLAHQNYMIQRRRFLLHIRGVKFNNDTMEGLSPTNEELEIGDNWTRVYEAKNVRVVRVRHNILM
jgi:hypothetical protein